MNKYLLSIALTGVMAFGSLADEHTLVFDGDNDMYGLTRQTTIKVNDMTFTDEFSFTEEGIDFELSHTGGTGKGFALVNAGGANAGIYISSSIDTKISITVPKGTVKGAKIYLSGYALMALDIDFNGKTISSENEGSLYYWSWTSTEESDNLIMTWPQTFGARYIHSIELSYTRDLGGKQESGLAFSESAAEAIIGRDFTPPTLENPNNLPLTWTSSNEKVATVDAEGNLTLVAGGKTTITVATEGNDSFAAGNAKYELSVVPSASNIPELLSLAPEVRDRVLVNFPVTVTFGNGNFAFVIDEEGNPGYIEDTRNQGSTSTTSVTLYKVGNVIPAGWIANNATIYESVLWQGLPEAVSETVEVTYPEVLSVSRDDVDKVLILKEVTFSTPTASGNTKAYGTTSDGGRYEFQDTYNIPVQPAGTYDVTGVVRYSKVGSTEYFYISPIAYMESKPSSISEIENDTHQAKFYNLQGQEVTNPQNGIFIKKTLDKTSKILVQ